MSRPPLPLETWGNVTRLTHHGKPAARLSYRDTDGTIRRILRTGTTFAQAERTVLESVRQRLAPTFEDLNADSTVLEAVTKYLDGATHLADSTIVGYRNATKNIIELGFGAVLLREVTVPRAERFLKLVTDKNGPSSAKSIRSILNNALTDAVRLGAIPSNPVAVTTVPKAVKKEILAPSLTAVQEIRALIRAYNDGTDKRGLPRVSDIADLIDLYAATGARTSELLALRWDAVNLDTMPATLTIRSTVITGLDGKLKVQDHPKTSRSIRELKLPNAAASILTARRVNSHGDIVFPSSVGTFRSPHNLRRMWRDALAGTPFSGWTPRDFRKSVATLLTNEMSVEAARDQLGHHNSSVTIGHYIQPTHEGPDATEVLERLFQKGY
jgi:integrase